MRPRHKPGCTAFFHTPASGCPCFGLQTRPGWRPVAACRQSVGGFGFRLSPFPDGFRTRVAPVFGCPRSPTVSGRGLHRFPAVPVPRRFPDAGCSGFRLSPFPDGFRTRIAPVSGCPRSPTVSGRGLHRLPAVPVLRRFSAAVCLWLAVLRRRPSGCGHGSLRPPPALPVHPDLLLYPT